MSIAGADAWVRFEGSDEPTTTKVAHLEKASVDQKVNKEVSRYPEVIVDEDDEDMCIGIEIEEGCRQQWVDLSDAKLLSKRLRKAIKKAEEIYSDNDDEDEDDY